MSKTLIAAAMAGVFTMGAAGVMAGQTDAYFNPETQQLVLPHLQIGDSIFYATLNLADAATLTFVADASSFEDFTAPAAVGDTVNTSADAIVGTWGFPGSDTTITFNSDGSYSQFQAEAEDEGSCPAGGTESGTYTWAPETGVLLSNATVDNNGECGLSNPRDGVPLRIFIDGDAMQILERGDGTPLEEFAATRQ
ncbi:MAG: hypothetical protein R3332_09750 [Pseudohongiellaceae bacterium]|nr:hypothetical protein [Pseudohongiellaceae bacterium]